MTVQSIIFSHTTRNRRKWHKSCFSEPNFQTLPDLGKVWKGLKEGVKILAVKKIYFLYVLTRSIPYDGFLPPPCLSPPPPPDYWLAHATTCMGHWFSHYVKIIILILVFLYSLALLAGILLLQSDTRYILLGWRLNFIWSILLPALWDE